MKIKVLTVAFYVEQTGAFQEQRDYVKVLKEIGFNVDEKNNIEHKYSDDKQRNEIAYVFVEINTLEDLMKFQEKVLHPIIINGDTITIYDDYLN
jgi:hypothetical protein